MDDGHFLYQKIRSRVGISFITICVFSISFFCGGMTSSFAQSACEGFDYQGVYYEADVYGGLCWMRSNLRSSFYNDGTKIPLAVTYLQNADYLEQDGRLYDWTSASRVSDAAEVGPLQGVCPDGWRLPTLADFSSLVATCGAEKLLSPTRWLSGNSAVSTDAGFLAYPSGWRTPSGRYVGQSLETFFWTSDVRDTGIVAAGFGFACPELVVREVSAVAALSVRCVRDGAVPIPDTLSVTVTPDESLLYTCGDTMELSYQATVTGARTYTFKWSVNGADSVSQTGSVFVARLCPSATTTYYVKCEARCVEDPTRVLRDSVSSKLNPFYVPSMTVCTDCEAGKVMITSVSSVYSASWRNEDEEVVSRTKTTGSKVSLAAGTYHIVLTNRTSNCQVTLRDIVVP